jgi:hypothetical protein
MIKTLLKEPLLHFLLIGAAFFYFYSLTSNSENDGESIVITGGKLAQLTYSFEKTRQRAPTEEELAALIENYFKQQVAYKKGVEMGLLENDSIIQQRIQQKLEFIVEDAVSVLEPSDEQLTTFLNEHQDDYRNEQVFTFRQLYFDPSKHDDITSKMNNVLSVINKKTTDEVINKRFIEDKLLPLSDSIYLEYQYNDMPYGLVARYFGSRFAGALVAMPLNNWQKDIKSGYGVHIVELNNRAGGDIQPLAQVRLQVKKDWLAKQRDLSLDKFYQALFIEYGVDIK